MDFRDLKMVIICYANSFCLAGLCSCLHFFKKHGILSVESEQTCWKEMKGNQTVFKKTAKFNLKLRFV